jgi:hypothetical protein
MDSSSDVVKDAADVSAAASRTLQLGYAQDRSLLE